MKIESTDAMIVVDVQNDFCPGGALAVAGGDEIVPLINGLVRRFRHSVFTRDWHPADHCSFEDPPRFVDGSWPAHCVQDTAGAVFHTDLLVPDRVMVVSKATGPSKEAYSGFDDTTLAEDLRAHGVTRLFVCGLATDYCVKATALDGLKAGFDVVIVEDACRGVDNPPGAAAAALDAMRAAGAVVCGAEDVE